MGNDNPPSALPPCEHHYVSTHQPDFPPEVYWVKTCSFCGHHVVEGRVAAGIPPYPLSSPERALAEWAAQALKLSRTAEAGVDLIPVLIARIRELEAENAKIDDLDEALRQRDREILGLRRDRDALAAVRTLAAEVKLRMVPSGGVETLRHRGAVEFAEEVLGAVSGKSR